MQTPIKILESFVRKMNRSVLSRFCFFLTEDLIEISCFGLPCRGKKIDSHVSSSLICSLVQSGVVPTSQNRAASFLSSLNQCIERLD
jgi:hypothetical protein